MDTIPLDYATLRLIWWLLLGILLIGFAVMDGFDLGVATLLPAVARTDEERRIVLNVIGPVWEGNQVWLILGGGAIFAAFPPLYAVSFSGFYIAMFLILVALILRPVGFKFRSKVPDPRWRAAWDWALFVSGLVPALVFGVAMGNVLLGVPFHFDDTLRIFYEGGLFGLLTPFALLCGLVSVAMLVMHGAAMLAMKTSGAIAERARRYGSLAALATDLGRRMDDVVVLTMSEFGRTARENGSRGTDHGHGNAMFVIGGPVRGGKVYGDWKGLKPGELNEGRDLAVTTDFRDVFAEVSVEHLGNKNLDKIFPNYAAGAAKFRNFLG